MTRDYVVDDDDTAVALGSGDVPVLATPRLVAWLEAATVDACPPLPEGSTTVGTRVDIEHLLASPIGARVRVQAALVHRDDRLLRFEVTAFDDASSDAPRLIAHGQVTRVAVDRQRFLSRVG